MDRRCRQTIETSTRLRRRLFIDPVTSCKQFQTFLKDRALVDDLQPKVDICRPANGHCKFVGIPPSNTTYLFNGSIVDNTDSTNTGGLTYATLRDQRSFNTRQGIFSDPLISQPPINAALLYVSRSPYKTLISSSNGLRRHHLTNHTTNFFQSYRNVLKDCCGIAVRGEEIPRGPNPMTQTMTTIIPNVPTNIPCLGMPIWLVATFVVVALVITLLSIR